MTKSAEHRRLGAFEFDTRARELRDASGKLVSLRPQTAHVLTVLIFHRGELVTKDRLMAEVWRDTHVTDDSLVQCVSEIRKALGTAGKLLKTVPRQGYRLVEEGTPPSPAAPAGGRFGLHTKLSAAAVLLLAALIGGWLLWGLAETERRTIAVLPFVNMSGDAEQDYFSRGLAEDLLTDLSKIGSLTVLSRATSFAHAERRQTPDRIAAELGATHVIDGSVRRDGDRLRISVQLVATESGVSVWAERYDRELGRLFDLQDEVRQEIISALALQLAPTEAERLDGGRPPTFAAYDLLLRGRHEEAALSRDGVIRATRFYEQAIAADPSYGAAHARLANMYDFLARFGWTDNAARDRDRALRMAEAAVRLDPRDAFAHWTRGRVLSRLGTDDGSAALTALTRAIELDPNHADAHAYVSLLHIGAGRTEEAVAAIAKAIKLNPDMPSWYVQNLGIIHYMSGDLPAAVADFERAVERNPTAPFTRLWFAAALARAGSVEDAEWQLQEAEALGAPATIGEALASNPVLRHPPHIKAYAEGLRLAGLPE